jgi:hypothetical protein
MPVLPLGKADLNKNFVTIDADKVTWEDISDDLPAGARLLARVVISGHYFHLEAREVRFTDPENPVDYDMIAFPEDIEPLIELSGDVPSHLVEIEGRTYLIFMTPYC